MDVLWSEFYIVTCLKADLCDAILGSSCYACCMCTMAGAAFNEVRRSKGVALTHYRHRSNCTLRMRDHALLALRNPHARYRYQCLVGKLVRGCDLCKEYCPCKHESRISSENTKTLTESVDVHATPIAFFRLGGTHAKERAQERVSRAVTSRGV